MKRTFFIHEDCTSTEPPKSSHDRTLKGVRDFAEDVRVVSAKTTLINKNGFLQLAMYIHKSIDYFLREDLLRSDIESVSIQVKLGNYKPFIVTSLYRPPGKPVAYFNELDNLFGTLDTEDKETIYLGDTNCDMLDPANNDTKHLKKLFIKFNLVQLIKDPTRTTATTKTIIDHIITNKPEFVSESGVLSCGISDHDVHGISDKTNEVTKTESTTKSIECQKLQEIQPQCLQTGYEKCAF